MCGPARPGDVLAFNFTERNWPWLAGGRRPRGAPRGATRPALPLATTTSPARMSPMTTRAELEWPLTWSSDLSDQVRETINAVGELGGAVGWMSPPPHAEVDRVAAGGSRRRGPAETLRSARRRSKAGSRRWGCGVGTRPITLLRPHVGVPRPRSTAPPRAARRFVRWHRVVTVWPGPPRNGRRARRPIGDSQTGGSEVRRSSWQGSNDAAVLPETGSAGEGQQQVGGVGKLADPEDRPARGIGVSVVSAPCSTVTRLALAPVT